MDSSKEILFNIYKESFELHYAFQAIFQHTSRGKYDYNIADDMRYLAQNPPNKQNIYSNYLVDLTIEKCYPACWNGFSKP